MLGLSVLLSAVEDEAVRFVPLASPVLPARGGLEKSAEAQTVKQAISSKFYVGNSIEDQTWHITVSLEALN